MMQISFCYFDAIKLITVWRNFEFEDNIGAVLLYYPLKRSQDFGNQCNCIGKHRHMDYVCFPSQRLRLRLAALACCPFCLAKQSLGQKGKICDRESDSIKSATVFKSENFDSSFPAVYAFPDPASGCRRACRSFSYLGRRRSPSWLTPFRLCRRSEARASGLSVSYSR
jgi:hypothetical protein